MSFTGGIPQSGQSLGQTRDAIRNNFTNYNDTIKVNHIAPNSAGAGKHTFAEFVVQAASPATTTGEVSVYSRAISAIPELFLQKENQLVGAADIQMSRLDKGVLAGATGWTFLPGGLIMQWGSTGVVNGAFTTNYIARGGISFTTNTYRVFLTVDDPGAPGSPIPSFTINSALNLAASFSGNTNRSITLNYVAIGS